MSRKKAPGQKLPPGTTKREILKIVLQHWQGIEETEIRKALRMKYNINDMRGIKRHLKDLLSEELLIKEEKPGKPNIWKFNIKSFLKTLNDPELHPFLLDWLISVCKNKSWEDEIKNIELTFEWFIQVVETLKKEKKIVELLRTPPFQLLIYYVVNRLVAKAALSIYSKDELYNKEIRDFPEEYKSKLIFLATKSPSCFVTILKFINQMNLLEYREIWKIIHFLELDPYTNVILLGAEIEASIRKELGILLYTAIKNDITNGILDKNFIDKYIQSQKNQTLKIDERKGFFKKIKRLLPF